MNHVYLSGSTWHGGPGEWREDELLAAHRNGRIADSAIYTTAVYVRGRPDIAAPFGYAVVTDPPFPPGDIRDPDHAIYGPFPTNDEMHLSASTLGGSWVALTHGPRTLGEIAAWVEGGKATVEPKVPVLEPVPEPAPAPLVQSLVTKSVPEPQYTRSQKIVVAVLAIWIGVLVYVYAVD